VYALHERHHEGDEGCDDRRRDGAGETAAERDRVAARAAGGDQRRERRDQTRA
jgi:hypothetical protein